MKYKNITKAKFIKRPNRFIAHVEVVFYLCRVTADELEIIEESG